MAEISRSTHYEWLKDPEYEREFNIAFNIGKQALKDQALERIKDGKSDTMLIFMMKGAFPDEYRERWDGHISGATGGPIEITTSSRELVEARIDSVIARLGAEADTRCSE